MDRFISYDGRLHKVLDEDCDCYLIDAKWHPSDKSMPCIAEKRRIVERRSDNTAIYAGYELTDYVLNCGINWATDECATYELAQRCYAKRIAEGRRLADDCPQYDSVRGIYAVHFHW